MWCGQLLGRNLHKRSYVLQKVSSAAASPGDVIHKCLQLQISALFVLKRAETLHYLTCIY